MNGKEEEASRESVLDGFSAFAIIMAIGLFVPFAVNAWDGSVFIAALLWQVKISHPGFEFLLYEPIMINTGYLILRIAFAGFVGRWFQGKSTRKKVILVGLLSEGPILLMAISSMIAMVTGVSPFEPLLIIPAPIVIAFVLARLFPPPRIPFTAFDGDEPEDWWDSVKSRLATMRGAFNGSGSS